MILLAVAVVIALCLFIFMRGCRQELPVRQVPLQSDTATAGDSGDTLVLPEAADTASADTGTIADTVSPAVAKAVKPAVDTTMRKKSVEVPDTVEKPSDTVAADTSADTASAGTGLQEDPCGRDTTELWVYPDPSGGLHNGSVNIVFVANRPAKIQYRKEGESSWHMFDGGAVPLEKTTTLYYDAIDSCGRVMERRSEYYEIGKADDESLCDASMALVKVGGMRFCIDRYEWPNRKGSRPEAFVSYYQAGDSCYSAGKRLCTAEEWSMACSGPYSGKYPYGQVYERYGCVTHDTVVAPSGSKPECRSFFGVFDMSGNLLEWTSTRATENSTFYYVMGGFWESGPKSGCFDKRYSYYPQNRHNPVGFRCCSDVAGGTPSGKR